MGRVTRLPSRDERERRARALAEVERLAWLLDNSIRVPGTGGRRFGLDALIGFVPVVGDLLGSAIALFVVWRGTRLRLPKIVVARMLANAALDLAIGAVPVVGDAFDLWFKASSRNLALMRRYLDDPEASTRREWVAMGALLAMVLLVIGLLVWLVVGVVSTLGRLFAM